MKKKESAKMAKMHESMAGKKEDRSMKHRKAESKGMKHADEKQDKKLMKKMMKGCCK